MAVSKETMHSFHMQRSSLTKLNEVQGKEQYQFEISNSFTVLENLDDDVDNNRGWEIIR
jgi:hypothetical protein